MKYIPDKTMFKAVMFALKMCPTLEFANMHKIHIAANYYHVDPNEIFEIVNQELWERLKKKVNEEVKIQWITLVCDADIRPFLNTHTQESWLQGCALICPKCLTVRSCPLCGSDYECDKCYLFPCSCGFVDWYQRNYIRKTQYEYMIQKGLLKNETEKTNNEAVASTTKNI